MTVMTLLLLWSIATTAFAQDAKLIEAAKKEGRLVLARPHRFKPAIALSLE